MEFEGCEEDVGRGGGGGWGGLGMRGGGGSLETHSSGAKKAGRLHRAIPKLHWHFLPAGFWTGLLRARLFEGAVESSLRWTPPTTNTLQPMRELTFFTKNVRTHCPPPSPNREHIFSSLRNQDVQGRDEIPPRFDLKGCQPALLFFSCWDIWLVVALASRSPSPSLFACFSPSPETLNSLSNSRARSRVTSDVRSEDYRSSP